MSFGYSVGDFVTLVQLSWSVYKACKDAPISFGDISTEVLSLHAVLKEAEETIFAHPLPPSTRNNLRMIGEGCHNVLTDLQTLTSKYKSLGTNNQRTWDRLQWAAEDIDRLRSRLISNISMFNTYISLSQFTVKKKLESFSRDYQDDEKGSVYSSLTVDSLSPDERQMWRTIRKELEEIGISVAAFDANREFILKWLIDHVVNGSFQEKLPGNGSLDDSVTGLIQYNAGKTRGQEDCTSPEGLIWDPPALQRTEERKTQGNSVKSSQKELDPKISSRLISWIQPKKAFLNSVVEGDISQVRKLLNDTSKINAIDHKIVTRGMMMAIRQGDLEIVETLLKRVTLDELGFYDALREAFISDRVQILRLLVEQEYDRRWIAKWCKSVLMNAAFDGKVTTVALLLQKLSETSTEDYEPCVSGTFQAASVRGCYPIVELLLASEYSLTHLQACDLNDGLCVASTRGCLPIVELLLDRGAEVNTSRFWFGNALQTASYNGHLEIVSLLLDRGADINAAEFQYGTAFQAASFQGHDDVVNLLISRGADVNIKGGMY